MKSAECYDMFNALTRFLCDIHVVGEEQESFSIVIVDKPKDTGSQVNTVVCVPLEH